MKRIITIVVLLFVIGCNGKGPNVVYEVYQHGVKVDEHCGYWFETKLGDNTYVKETKRPCIVE